MNWGCRASIIIPLIIAMFVPTKIASADGDLSFDIPLQTLNGGQAIDLTGLMSTQTVEFTLPDSWDVKDQNWVEIDTTASELLDFADASLTISLNGLQVASFRTTIIAGNTKSIAIPANFFKQGKNILTFEGLLYLSDDRETNCRVWDDPSRWLVIGPKSSLHISFQKKSLSVDLTNFPKVFLQPLEGYLTNGENQTLIILPDDTKQDDLNALAAVSYFLGHEAGENFKWTPQILTQAEFTANPNTDKNIIFVNNIPSQFEKEISTEKDAIAMFPSPWDDSKAAMVISDQNREDGYTPALAFGDPAKKVLLNGSVAYLDKDTLPPAPAFKNDYSFEELGYFDRTVKGIGKENLIYRIYIPYQVDPTTASLILQISHSPELDSKVSSFTIYLNGFTVASILPTDQSANLDPIHVDIPMNRFHPGVNFLRISFDLHLPYASCERSPESVWATIFNSSHIEITYRNRTPIPSLKDFPQPFNDDPGFSFIISNEKDTKDLGRVAQLAFSMGASSIFANQPPGIATATNYNSAKTSQTNLILVGSPLENNAIKEINPLLPQPFTDDLKNLQDGYGVYLPSADQNASTGLLQIIPSPWAKNGTILVLTGTDSQGIDWAWDVLLDPTMRDKFAGNIMVAGSNERTNATTIENSKAQHSEISFQQTPDVTKIPIIGVLLQKTQQAPLITALIAALAGLLIVLISLKVISSEKFRIKKNDHSEAEEKEGE